MNSTHEISKELRDLVSQSVKLLGSAAKEIYGDNLYQLIESLRLNMKEVRGADSYTVHNALEDVYSSLKKKRQMIYIR